MHFPRITVEAPVLSVGSRAADYEELGSYVDALRWPQGLHLTLLHIGVLEDFSQDVANWTKGITDASGATCRTVLLEQCARFLSNGYPSAGSARVSIHLVAPRTWSGPAITPAQTKVDGQYGRIPALQQRSHTSATKTHYVPT
jgi:hypothetical protein